MPRKKSKTTKTTKTTKTAKVSKKELFLSESMDKDLRALISKLPVQLQKDLTAAKKVEAKQKSAIAKYKKQLATAKKKFAALNAKVKKSATATLKKQVATAKKACDTLTVDLKKTQEMFVDTKQNLKMLKEKSAHTKSVCKYIATLDKELAKKNAEAKKPKKAKKAQATKKPSKKEAAQAVQTPVSDYSSQEASLEKTSTEVMN